MQVINKNISTRVNVGNTIKSITQKQLSPEVEITIEEIKRVPVIRKFELAEAEFNER